MENNVRAPLLEIAPYHRSEADAREYVGKLAEKLGVANYKTKLSCGKSVSIPTSGKQMEVNFRREVRQARLTGVPPLMQGLIDNSDPLFFPIISMGASAKGIIKISVRYGSGETTIDGDGIIEAPISALADDVLYFRRQCVECSVQHDLTKMARAYRTYLQVSISLVDAFLGHATFALGEKIPDIKLLENFQVLKNTTKFVERIEAWCGLYNYPSKLFRETKNWSDLNKLRQQRNRYVHPSEPCYSLAIDEVVNVLNQCRDGVGGTLEHLRTIACYDSCLSYIQKVKTAPFIKKN